MDAVLDDCMEVGPAYLHEQPRRHPLLCQFDAGVQEFEAACRRRGRGRTPVGELLSLGAVRQCYWLLLAEGATTQATEIANWWYNNAAVHGLGQHI